MLRILCLLFLCHIDNSTFGQTTICDSLSIRSDLKTQSSSLPTKISIELDDLAGYSRLRESSEIYNRWFIIYKNKLLEPNFLKLIVYWPNYKVSRISLWVTSSPLEFHFNDENFVLLNVNNSNDVIGINQLELTISDHKLKLDTLVKSVNYQDHSIANAERVIDFIRDSVNNSIDDLYKESVSKYSKSWIGLYALCKYAERPYMDQRKKFQPDTIQKMLASLDKSIQELPSARILANSLLLNQALAVGKQIKELSLLDTIGVAVRLSDFKGKYVLLDFWASWCSPCRQQHPELIKIYAKFRSFGFQVMSITRDSRYMMQNWLTAISQDRINIWPHLSNFNDVARSYYDIRFLPANYLIDQNGINFLGTLIQTHWNKFNRKLSSTNFS